jgi:hypothetical protein
MFDYAYTEPHAQVQAEREELAAYLDSFNDEEAAR